MSISHPDILAKEHTLKAGWAADEFGQVNLGDARRTRRLVHCAESMAEHPGKSIPQIADGWAETKAFYRMLDCEELTDEAVFDAHRQATLRRAHVSGESIFLAAQDTTTLNYTSHKKLKGQGQISNSEQATGLHLHSTLLIGAQSGECFGLLGSKIYAREGDKRRRQKAGTRNRERIEQKESYRWMESFELARCGQLELQSMDQDGESGKEPITIISVGDREADIYELLLEAQAHRDQGLGLLVRSRHNRELADAEEKRLWEELAESPCRGKITVSVPAKKANGGGKIREAILEIRFKKVTIQAPAHKTKYLGMSESVEVWVIDLREEGGKKEGIHWRLLSTLEIKNVAQACQASRWYSLRWQIEEFHRVLKTGCRVEKRQLQKMERMRPMIALDMVVACLILGLRQAARSRPEAPATKWLGRDEVNALVKYCKHKHKNKKKLLADLDPDTLGVGRAVSLIAMLGGHLGRKGDGPPGAEVLWRGICELHTITAAYLAFAT